MRPAQPMHEGHACQKTGHVCSSSCLLTFQAVWDLKPGEGFWFLLSHVAADMHHYYVGVPKGGASQQTHSRAVVMILLRDPDPLEDPRMEPPPKMTTIITLGKLEDY